MNNPLPRLLDALLPWRVTIRHLRDQNNQLRRQTDELANLLNHATRERDTARRQFNETRGVNLHNAAAHRASEVAALMSNNAQQGEIERLRLALAGGKGRAVESREMPALYVPAPIPVQQPALKSP